MSVVSNLHSWITHARVINITNKIFCHAVSSFSKLEGKLKNGHGNTPCQPELLLLCQCLCNCTGRPHLQICTARAAHICQPINWSWLSPAVFNAHCRVVINAGNITSTHFLGPTPQQKGEVDITNPQLCTKKDPIGTAKKAGTLLEPIGSKGGLKVAELAVPNDT